MRVVKRRAHQIVHGRIHNDEGFGLAPLHKEDACHENASVARDQPSRLEDQLAIERCKPCLDNLRVALRVIALRILPKRVWNTETAAEIDMIDGVAVGAQQADKIGDQPKGGVEGGEVGNLRADVDINSGDLIPGRPAACA